MKGYHSDIPGYSPILVILSNYRVNSAIIKVNKDQYLVSDLLYYVRKVRLPMIARLIQYVGQNHRIFKVKTFCTSLFVGQMYMVIAIEFTKVNSVQ